MSLQQFIPGITAVLGSGDLSADTLKAMLLDMSQTDVALKAITGVTNATPMVVTSASHGFTAGDIVVQRGITGNLAANGTFRVGTTTTDTYQLKTLGGANTTGSGAYSAGGQVINLTLADGLDDLNAGRVATDASVTTPALSNSNGLSVFDADDVVFSGVTNGSTSHAVVYYKYGGSDATSKPFLFNDGRQVVEVMADASSSATTLWVKPLLGGIASGQTIVLTNGVTATLSGAAVAGARSLSVTALPGAVTAGHHGDAVIDTGSSPNFPMTGNGGSITVNHDNGGHRVFAIGPQE